MSEKFEKCPNCGAKLSGWFSKSIIEDDQIKKTNESINIVRKLPVEIINLLLLLEDGPKD